MPTRIRFLLAPILLWTLAGCVRPPVTPGLVCVPVEPAAPLRGGGELVLPGGIGQRARAGPSDRPAPDRAVRGPHRERGGRGSGRASSPSVTVRNIGPVPAGAFNVAVDVGVSTAAAGPRWSTAAIVRVPGLAANADTTVAFDRMQGVTLRAGDRLTISAVADPQPVPGSPLNVFGEILELDETNNSAVQNCTVPG